MTTGWTGAESAQAAESRNSRMRVQFGQTPETIRLARLEGLDPGSRKKDGAQAPARRAKQP